MGVLEEAAQLAVERIGPEADELTIERLVVGVFFTGVKLSNGVGGIAYTPIKDMPEAVCCPSSAGAGFDPWRVRGRHVSDVLPALSSDDALKTATAMATLNALSAMCWERGGLAQYGMHLGADAQDFVRMPPETSVAVVGALVPTLRALRKRGGNWWVIEQDPRTLKDDELPHYVPAAESESVVRTADVLVITGVTLLNHTLEGILSVARPDAEIAVLGPTASMLPDPLFARGVRVVGGVWVRQPDTLLDVLAAGGSGYHFFDTLADRIVVLRS